MLVSRNSSEIPSEILTEAINNYIIHKPCFIIINGNMTDDFTELLKNWGKTFYDYKIVASSEVLTYNILPILSGDIEINEQIDSIISVLRSRKNVTFFNGFHQISYNLENGYKILSGLIAAYNSYYDLAPLVLNFPGEVWEKMMSQFPKLKTIALSLRIYDKYSKNSPINCAQGTGNMTYNESKDYNNPSVNNSSIYTKEKTDTKETGPVKNPLKSGNTVAPKIPSGPWYVQNLQLLKREKDGMTALLENTNSTFAIATMPRTKRLYWKLRLIHNTEWYDFDISMKILYSDSFTENNPSVGVVVENLDREFERMLDKKCLRKITMDSEEKVIYLVNPLYLSRNHSEAAAALNGFINILNQIR